MEPLVNRPCRDGRAGPFSCDSVDLGGFLPLSSLGDDSGSASSTWGWTDVASGREFAIIGLSNGTAFVEVTDPFQPRLVGRLELDGFWIFKQSLWREMQTYEDHAFIVSEADGHAMVVVDLRPLLDVGENDELVALTPASVYRDGPDDPAPPVDLAHPNGTTFTVPQVLGQDGTLRRSHTIFIHQATGFAYLFGSNTCNGGAHVVDIRDPEDPRFVSCFSDRGYTHDGQCVTYHGPDADYQGRELCFLAQGEVYDLDAEEPNRIAIVDMSDKSNPTLINEFNYPDAGYSHQGVLTEDHSFFLFDDELDEEEQRRRMRTFIIDVRDLDAPSIAGIHEHRLTAIDHNQHVVGNRVYQADYTAGLRIFRLDEVRYGRLVSDGFFDPLPDTDAPVFRGFWNVYPDFPSGTVTASSIDQGLFVLVPKR